MKRCILLVLLMAAWPAWAQQRQTTPLFHNSGTMPVADLLADTIIRITWPDQSIRFEHIDTATLEAHTPLYALLQSYLGRSNDSTEYFYLYNGSSNPINLELVKHQLKGVEMVQNNKGEIRPASFIYLYHGCGRGLYSDLKLQPSSLLVIRYHKVNTGPFRTKAKLRLAINGKDVLTTGVYTTSIAEMSFFINRAYEVDILRYKACSFLEP